MSPTYVASEFPDDLKDQILSVIGDRLNTGEVLLSESQFVAAPVRRRHGRGISDRFPSHSG